MTISRRALSLSGVGVVLAGAVLVACSDSSDPLGPSRPETPKPGELGLFAVHCEASISTGVMSCGDATSGEGARQVIVGNQGVYVRLTSSNLQVIDVPDPATADTFAVDVTVKNQIRQAMGINPDGTPSADGVRVFFYTGPTALPTGTADVANEDDDDIFLGSSQPYFRYPQVLEHDATSAVKRWKVAYTHGATSLRFTVYVDAAVQFPLGRVELTPKADTLAPGQTVQLSGTARNVVGVALPAPQQVLTYSSSDQAVATVSASGLVTAVARGTATITATNGLQSGTMQVVVNSAPMAVDDVIDALGNVTIPVDAAKGVLVNDTDPDGAGGGSLSVVAGTFATARGGSVTLAADGSLVYRGPARFEAGYDSVQYTVTDGTESSQAYLKMNVGQRVWYVRPGAAAAGDGTDAAPFNALTGVDSIASADEPIYVLDGGTTPPVDNGITLKTGQSLIGQAVSAPITTTLNGRSIVLLIPGAAPLAQRTTPGAAVTLGTNNTVMGLRIASTAGAALSGTSFGTLTADSVTLEATGGPALSLATGTATARFLGLSSTGSTTTGVGLTAVNGTISAKTGSLDATFAVSGGSVAVTYDGAISETDAALVSVTGTHTGALTFNTGTLSATGGTGLQFSDADGSYQFNGPVTLNGGDAGVDVLAGSGGTFGFGAGVSITNPTGTALNVSASAPTLTFAGDISTNAARPVAVDGLTGGSVQLSGAIAATGLGILVQNSTGGAVRFNGDASAGKTKTLNTAATPAVTLVNNTGSSVQFAGGGLSITTTSGHGFFASGGGLVEVTGDGNTVSTGSGTAVQIENTTITGSGVTFVRVSANGGTNGIVLNNTGSTNGFQVTGDGSNAAGSGGTIQNTTGAAVSLTSTLATQLNHLTVSNAAWGIVGNSFGTLTVNGVSLASTSAGGRALSLTTGDITGTFSSVSASGATNGVYLSGVTGLFAANGGTITGGVGAAFEVAGGTVGVLWSGSISQANAAPLVSVGGGHSAGTLTFQTGTLSATGGRGLQFNNADGTYAFGGTTTLNGGGAGIDVTNGSAGTFTFGAGTTLTSAAPGDTAVYVAGSNPQVTYSGSLSKTTTGPLVQLTDVSGGNVTFNTGTLQASAGTGLQFSNADGTVAFNGQTILSGGDTGIDLLAGSDGSFTFGPGVGITNPSGAAFVVNGSSPTVAVHGPITKSTAGRIVDITNMAAGTITFGSGTVAGGQTPVLTASGGDGILLSNVDGTVNFTGNTLLDGGNATLDVLNGSDGNILFANSSSITGRNAAEVALDVNGGTPALVFRGTVTHNTGRVVSVQNITGDSVVVMGSVVSGTSAVGGNTGRGILVQNNTGGTVVFSSSISKSFFTGANPAISLSNNTGTSMRFAGGNLAITTTTGNGFSATGGGNVRVTGANNTVTSAGGIAVNVVNTTIAPTDVIAGGMSFVRVNATGGTNGIVVNNAGTGGFQVTGDGASDAAVTTRGRITARSGGGTIALGSGGTIQSTTGKAVLLRDAGNIVLRNLVIQNNGSAGADSTRAGISAGSVTGLELDNLLVSGHTGNYGLRAGSSSNVTITHSQFLNNATTPGVEATDIWNVRLDNLSGTSLFRHSLFQNSVEMTIGWYQMGTSNGTVSIQNAEISGTTAGNGVNMSAFNSATANLSVTGSRIQNNTSTGFQYATNDASGGTVTVQQDTLDQNTVDISLAHQGAGRTVDYTVNQNITRQTFDAGSSNSINVYLGGTSTASTLMRGTISNNVVGNAAIANSGADLGRGIFVEAAGAGTGTAVVTNNTVRQIKQESAFYGQVAKGTATAATSPRLNLTITGNDFQVNTGSVNALAGVELTAGTIPNIGDNPTLCANIGPNTAFVGQPTFAGVYVVTSGFTGSGTSANPTVELQGYAGAANNLAQIEAFLGSSARATTNTPAPILARTTGTVRAATAPCPTS